VFYARLFLSTLRLSIQLYRGNGKMCHGRYGCRISGLPLFSFLLHYPPSPSLVWNDVLQMVGMTKNPGFPSSAYCCIPLTSLVSYLHHYAWRYNMTTGKSPTDPPPTPFHTVLTPTPPSWFLLFPLGLETVFTNIGNDDHLTFSSGHRFRIVNIGPKRSEGNINNRCIIRK
jgi:hypothetical protein